MFISKTSSRRLQDVFSITIFCLPRRLARCLQDVFKRYLQDFFKTSRKTKNCYAVDMLKASSRYVLKTSWRPTNVCWVTSRKYAVQCSNILWRTWIALVTLPRFCFSCFLDFFTSKETMAVIFNKTRAPASRKYVAE